MGIWVGRIDLPSINARRVDSCSRPRLSGLSHGDRSASAVSGRNGPRATLESLDPIDEAWARVEADWASEEAHRQFVAVCVALDRLAEAGKRYRDARETDPSRSEDAARHIETLIVLATQRLLDTRVAPATSNHKRTLTWVAFTMMLLLMAAGAWLLMRG